MFAFTRNVAVRAAFKRSQSYVRALSYASLLLGAGAISLQDHGFSDKETQAQPRCLNRYYPSRCVDSRHTLDPEYIMLRLYKMTNLV